MIAIDEFVALGSRTWWLLAGLTLVARSCDLLSTRLASPKLLLEGNPIARRLGWKYGIILNAALSLTFACWPLMGLSLTTTSFLVAARNLQSAWVMRSMGELNYRCWMAERIAESPRFLPWGCFLGEAFLFALIGTALLLLSGQQLVPFSIGMGLLGYSAAVALFTTLSLWRSRDWTPPRER